MFIHFGMSTFDGRELPDGKDPASLYAPDKLDVELFPRLCALAEIGWTSKANRNFADFAKRLRAHRLRAKALGIHLIYDGPHDRDCPWRG